MKKIILFTLSVLCILMLLCSCGSSSKLVGVWEEIDGDGILYFAEDGTGLSKNVDYTSESFEYKEKNDTLTFIGEKTVDTEYTVEKSILTIKADGSEYQYEAVDISEDEIDEYLIKNGIENSDPPANGTDGTTKDTETDEPEKETKKPNEKGNKNDKAPTDKEIAESIVGGWWEEGENLSMLYVFYEDGTGVAGIFPFTYSVKDGVISMQVMGFGEVESGSARYEISGDCLYVDGRDRDCVLTRTEVPEEYKEFPEELKEQLAKINN